MTRSYTMTADDFPNGCLTVTDAITGIVTATGENKLGITITAPLGVPLCEQCDAVLDHGFCVDCDTLVEVEQRDLGNGWRRAAA